MHRKGAQNKSIQEVHKLICRNGNSFSPNRRVPGVMCTVCNIGKLLVMSTINHEKFDMVDIRVKSKIYIPQTMQKIPQLLYCSAMEYDCFPLNFMSIYDSKLGQHRLCCTSS